MVLLADGGTDHRSDILRGYIRLGRIHLGILLPVLPYLVLPYPGLPYPVLPYPGHLGPFQHHPHLPEAFLEHEDVA